MPESDRLKWDARYREPGSVRVESSPLLTSLEAILPRRGRAIDVAGGAGRHALWLARRGLGVTLADISPVALGIAARAAEAEGLPLQTLLIDLEAEPFPAGPWDCILVFHFLWRPLLAAIPDALAPGGVVAVVHPTRTNLTRHERPGPEYLLDDGELPGLIRGLDLLTSEEGWLAEGRHEARLVARKPVGAADGDR